jgi:thioesterase domain-containing protein/acyl carrier protein
MTENGAERVDEHRAREVLKRIWCNLLKIDEVDEDASFFEIGGHSLLATRLITRVEEELGEKITISMLYERPTIAGLWKILRSKPKEQQVLINPLQRHGRRRPLFFVSTQPRLADALAAALGEDQPFYECEAPAFEGSPERFRDIEELASRLVDAITQIQKAGPYSLAGQCFGGLVALEVAQQLARKEHDVAFLGLFDCYQPHSGQHPAELRQTPWLRLRRHWWRIERFGPISWLREIAYAQWKRCRRMLRLVQPGDERSEEATWEHEREQVRLRLLEISRRYQPAKFAGSIVHFVACNTPPLDGDSRLAWDVIAADGMDLVPCRGNHSSMFDRRYAKELASLVSARLDSS